MKLFPNLVKAITDALEEIFSEGAYADITVERTLKKDARWGSRDRKFIASYVYDIVRWYRLFEACLTEEQKTGHKYSALFGIAHISKGYTLPAWDEFNNLNEDAIKDALHEQRKIRKINMSIPDWLDELGIAQFGESVWEKELIFLNQDADVFIRVNTLKTSVNKLKIALARESVDVVPIGAPLFNESNDDVPLKLAKRKQLQQFQTYKEGHFEIQDAASQLVAPYLQVKPGMKVIDACAGAGGKTLHIANLMHNKGLIIAMDKEAKKLQELERRAQRAGVNIIQTKLASQQTLEQLHASADRLLLDVPCSGLGVLRRNPDAKWKLNLDFINEIIKVQAQILKEYSTMLKPGGLMVYATCSILPIENQLQIAKFIAQNSDTFQLIAEQSIMPSQGYDGFYMAALKKL
jgi:16S rRNA (cytosine967-C5)-methyltransferase